ncbi:hypothetical protein BACT_0534 [Bifidobacterium actinocoloniiforme DSM 22766]|uniref:Uncharacterized protein n=1 Tax=Bifidobacterium actinocoloniiforme DSM 22766 TaxID=1437605 RepID=A0A086YZY3_9BIFI|nr:hypothetical protein [Bifidobacterium actinocoloniiforme]AKV55111.1 hypothetical protein AB656_01270 [Bifidobacterium actinocoloniiforme DSM 22766]KFI39833.1 hypothetical protein BACT_0534 [Bifidobacterium actinocoloniiforme DSM 22766]
MANADGRGAGASGVFEMMDFNGPERIEAYKVYGECTTAESIWPVDLLYFPKGVAPCPNNDVCQSFDPGNSSPDAANLDTTQPYLHLMHTHMNPMPDNSTAYRLKR